MNKQKHVSLMDADQRRDTSALDCRPDAIEQVTAILTEAGESVALLGEVIPAEGEHRVVYNGHLDLTW